MDGLVAQAGGMMNSNQRPPLSLLSMGYFLKHLLVIHHQTTGEAIGGIDALSREVFGNRRTPFEVFHCPHFVITQSK